MSYQFFHITWGSPPLESHINPYSSTPHRNHEATKALDRVEEERDEAFAAIAQWEATGSVEDDMYQNNSH